MLHPATLGGIPGFSDVQTSHLSPLNRWRGAFIFSPEDEPTIAELAELHDYVWYEETLEGERKGLPVKITAMSGDGLAFFEGVGEPQGAADGLEAR